VTILALTDLSMACFGDAHDDCVDPECLCHCHALEGLAPLDFDDASWVEYDRRAELREASR
jgi:hypothetical protein